MRVFAGVADLKSSWQCDGYAGYECSDPDALDADAAGLRAVESARFCIDDCFGMAEGAEVVQASGAEASTEVGPGLEIARRRGSCG
jgi:hypothetical protein